MKCYNCGFENKSGSSFCLQCGVNLKYEDSENFNDNVEVLNDELKVKKKRQRYPVPSENSIKAKLMYKRDYRTGKLRIAKTKCATLVVFSGFFIFVFLITILKFNIFVSIVTGLLFGFIFAFPVLIIGFVAGKILEKIFD